ncbi:radial spoke head 10 homolog B-like [Diprion similis]|uniref:radial spoke head 10 homolog B-like n=1 Tax=Diprion similis TaxID=362088 RepID=UPI001EF83BAC|nr:radial spoke head 10 homolog B-like [Diprion similis]
MTLQDEYVQVEFPNKNTYTGRVHCKQMEGDGTYRWKSGETFKGRFEQNLIEGNGRIEWNNQSWYEGEFHNGYRHGTGNFVSNDYGRFYTGQWYMGRKHGNGYCRYNKQDDYYEGEWNMDQRQGTGYRVYANGTRYIGQWEDGKRHGVGTMVWSNGDVYRGDWENGTMTGYGEYVWNGFLNKSLSWPQENSYMGDWLNGMRHGKGVLKLKSVGGAKYSGDWHMDKKHGYGMIIGNNGGVTEADPLFLNNILTSLDTESRLIRVLKFTKSFQITMLNTFDLLEGLGFPTVTLCCRSTPKPPSIEYKQPRKTTILEPLQCPSVWFHIQRLLQPKIEAHSSSITSSITIRSGKCYACSSDSECTCLYDSLVNLGESHSTESSEMTSSFFRYGTSSTSSKFCKHPKKSTEEDDTIEQTEEQYEKRWVHKCIARHILRLRKIYRLYAELYCSEKGVPHRLSMGKIALWQLMRDCNIHGRGISLIQFDRYIAINKSAFIDQVYYPFERIEFYQFLHALLEFSWHLYTKEGDIETEAVRGRLAGGLHKLLIEDIFPNAGKHVGKVSTVYRDLFPIYSVYQLYCDLGAPHTAKKFLQATCIAKGSSDPKPLPWPRPKMTVIPSYVINGINAVTVGEKLSYIPAGKLDLQSESAERVLHYEDDLAHELFALRHIGARKMISIIAEICPGIKDQETDMIINMDYELSFLEFYEILLEAARVLIYEKKVAMQEEACNVTANASAAAESLNHSQMSEPTESKHKSLKTSKYKKK